MVSITDMRRHLHAIQDWSAQLMSRAFCENVCRCASHIQLMFWQSENVAFLRLPKSGFFFISNFMRKDISLLRKHKTLNEVNAILRKLVIRASMQLIPVSFQYVLFPPCSVLLCTVMSYCKLLAFDARRKGRKIEFPQHISINNK